MIVSVTLTIMSVMKIRSSLQLLKICLKANYAQIQQCNLSMVRSSGTIFALSSGHGKCGVSIFRVSGVSSKEVIFKMTKLPVLPKARKLVLQRILDPVTGECLDRGLVVWFPGPRSYTGEDMCELHVHGSTAVQLAVYRALGKLYGFSPAEPGDFTWRSYINGKLALTEVEGLADLIHAETEMQRRQALRQMEGHLGKQYADWIDQMKHIVACIEAYIDFHEEDNLDAGIFEVAIQRINALLHELNDHLTDSRAIDRLRNGVNIAILGCANVGKSSLFNNICQKATSIISEIPGTTRDIVRSSLDIGGYPVVFADTAGIRETKDAIETEGITRAIAEAKVADLIIIVVDVSKINLMDPVPSVLHNLGSLSLSLDTCEQDGKIYFVGSQEVILVFNKVDLLCESNSVAGLIETFPQSCMASCVVKKGLTEFMDTLTIKIAALCNCSNDGVITSARHSGHLHQCIKHLENAIEISSNDVVLMAEALRRACIELGKIDGQITNEDILNVIFNTFCIGK